MLRVVLDTNIYIAAFLSPNGPNAKLWQAASQGRYLLLASPSIIKEVGKALRKYSDWLEPLIQIRIRQIAKVAKIIATSTTVNLIPADPSDNRILECAIDGKADLIVSNDRHLLNVKTCRGIPIVAGPDFRRTLGLR